MKANWVTTVGMKRLWPDLVSRRVMHFCLIVVPATISIASCHVHDMSRTVRRSVRKCPRGLRARALRVSDHENRQSSCILAWEHMYDIFECQATCHNLCTIKSLLVKAPQRALMQGWCKAPNSIAACRKHCPESPT
jgi:hypothetical protein